jgi:hypothetical protein
MSNGRAVAAVGTRYLVKAFLKRAQSTGTETGGVKVPLTGQRGQLLPGASGERYLYRGYALQYATVSSTFVLGSSSEDALTWTNIDSQPSWLKPASNSTCLIGNDPIFNGKIERSSGLFGGLGIDEIIYDEMGGIPLIVSGGELQN